MPQRGEHGELHLDGTPVGRVTFDRSDGSWHYGHFAPGPAFAEFAPVFGRWSLMMHADGDEERLSHDAADELRRVENELDAIRAKIYFPAGDQWVTCAQLTIDGPLIDWKRY